MLVAIKKFKESDDNEYVMSYSSIIIIGEKNCFERNSNLEIAQTRSHRQLD